MLDDQGRLLSPQQIFSLSETEEGKKQVAQFIWRARTALAAQKVMESLGLVPDPAVQTLVCEAIWDSIFRVSIFEIMDYCKQIVEYSEKSDINCVGRA